MVSVNDPRIIAGNRVHTRARLLTAQSKCRRMYGAAWKIKLVTGTVIGMKTDKVKGRSVTSVRAKRELSDGVKEVTLRIANIKAGEVMDLIDDDPEDHIRQETEHFARPEPTYDRVTPLEGALSLCTRISESDEMDSQDGLINVHGRAWKREEVTMHLYGMIPPRRWKVIGPIDEIISRGHSPSQMHPMDYFMWMFPHEHLALMVSYTNDSMESRGLRLTTRSEILKFFGVLILMTRIEFSTRRSLWSSQETSKYLPQPQFGNIISRRRFEELRQNVTFSFPADSNDRWGMIRDFIVAINDHRASHVIPSQKICVDESCGITPLRPGLGERRRLLAREHAARTRRAN